MPGLLTKIWIEVRWPVLLFSIGLFAVMALLTALLPKVLGEIHLMFDQVPLVRPLLTAMLGVDPGDKVSALLSQAFLWVHPTVLTLLWAHEVMYCSRMPAGEIDRGTADFLLCLPVSRWKLYCSETIGWLLSGICILALGYAGHLAASTSLQPEMRLTVSNTVMVMANLAAVYLAVGSFTFFISALSDRRGRAIGVTFAILLASFLLNVLAQFVDWAKSISPYLSVMEYYRPAIIIQSGLFPWSDILTLLALSSGLWIIGGLVFRHRSVCTV